MPRSLAALPLWGCALVALLTACSGTQKTPTGNSDPALPPPLAGINLTSVYRGDSTLSGSGCLPGMSCGPFPISVIANLTDKAGALSGHETVYVNGLLVSDKDLTSAGSNAGGRLSIPVGFEFCGQTVSLTLSGTVNPADKLNFARVTQAVTCKGHSGQFVVKPFVASKVVSK